MILYIFNIETATKPLPDIVRKRTASVRFRTLY